MEGVLHAAQRRLAMFVRRAQRNREGQRHAGQRRVHARLEHAQPKEDADEHIGCKSRHAGAVQQQQRQKSGAGEAQGQQRKIGRVEQRNDQDGGKVVHDRQGEKKDLQGGRYSPAKQGEHTKGEGDIGSGRDCPASDRCRIAPVERRVDEGRGNHAPDSRHARQRRLANAREFALEDFALYFQTHQQEEDRHQAVVDPQQQRLGQNELADLNGEACVEQRRVGRTRTGIGSDERNRRSGRQKHAAGRLKAEKVPDRGQRHGIFPRHRSIQPNRKWLGHQ